MEEQYLEELNQARAQTNPEILKVSKEKLKVPFPWFDFILALINDLGDYLIYGSIPILGDFIDILTSLIRWYRKHFRPIKTNNLLLGTATVIEFIPAGDVVPSYALEVLLNYMQEKTIAQAEAISPVAGKVAAIATLAATKTKKGGKK